MDDVTNEAGPLSSVELLDAALWREIDSEEPQPSSAFVEALAVLFGRWLILSSASPQMDLLKVVCRAKGYIDRAEKQSR